MLEKSFGLLFFLRRPSPFRPGPWLLMLRITVDGTRKEMSLKRTWPKERWDCRANCATGTKHEAKVLNTYLDVVRNKVYQAKTKLLEMGKPITAAGIRDILSGAADRHHRLLLIFKDHNNTVQKLIGKGYAQDYSEKFERVYGYAAAFLQSHYGQEDISIHALDLDFVKQFYTWLRTSRNCAHNTTIKYISMFKKVILECVDNGWLLSNPFAKFDMTINEVDTVYLTEDELCAIADKPFHSERLDQIRDIFIFCCLTSLAYIDVKQLKQSEVLIGVDGNLWIDKRRQKSKVPTKVPLLPITQKILDKYKSHPACVESGLLLPVISNAKYNDYLKEIASICGIQKNLTTHTARHTFGTTVTLNNDVPLPSVKQMMGHKRIEQTEHYSRILPLKVARDMKKLKEDFMTRNFLKEYDLMLSPPEQRF